ncbi:MAG: hypothetical protein ACD_75C00256G0001, partial [uncultured bacterium]
MFVDAQRLTEGDPDLLDDLHHILIRSQHRENDDEFVAA